MLKLAQKLIKDKKHFVQGLKAGLAKEAERLEEDGAAVDTVRIMKSKGLGDSIEKVTKATGIKAFVERTNRVLGKDCGCSARRDKLNKMFPYK